MRDSLFTSADQFADHCTADRKYTIPQTATRIMQLLNFVRFYQHLSALQMASSSNPGPSPSVLNVVIPIGLKRTRAPPEQEVADALENSSSIRKISIVAIPNKHDKKRQLNNCNTLAKWLKNHGSQLTELVLSMDEADEVKLMEALFKCPNLHLTKLLVSAADFPVDVLQKLPATLEVFSGHLGAHGDLTPFAALPSLKTLAVRCYPTHRYDGHDSTADIPRALLHHPTLQCLIIDVTSAVKITQKDVMCDGSDSRLKLMAITGDLSNGDVQELVAKAPKLQHLCLRCSPLSQMFSAVKQSSIALDLGKLADLRAVELGFPHLKTSFCGLQQLHKLSAVLLCGQFGGQRPALPKALAEASDEPAPVLMDGQIIVRRATVGSTNEKYKINVAMSLQHSDLIIEPKWVAELSDSIIAAA